MFVLPSYDELFPMTILEATNVNIPILVRDLPLYDPILGDKVLKAHNNGEFSLTLKKLREDPVLLAECALHSSELAGEYTPEVVFSKWDQFYQKILVEYGKKQK
uniref:CAZy families GT4 protein n=1 Tax=uncultured Lactobacillus sp. TaxID=153152 RepID=A0A060C230_9LACO|nr:CAZy families GT4 protein [uncultured Lactobacillus sp.]